jgi:hypothetical protein
MISCSLVCGTENLVRHRYFNFCTKDGGTLRRPGDDSRRVLGVSGAVREALTVAGTATAGSKGLFCYKTQTENIENFEWRLVSECIVKMLARWVVANRLSPRNIAHAHLSLSWQGSSPFHWTTTACIVCSAEGVRTVGYDLPVRMSSCFGRPERVSSHP